jgi:hypothetical protein
MHILRREGAICSRGARLRFIKIFQHDNALYSHSTSLVVRLPGRRDRNILLIADDLQYDINFSRA